MKISTLRKAAIVAGIMYSAFVMYSAYLFLWSVSNEFVAGAITTALYTLLTMPIALFALHRIWCGKLISGNWTYED